MGGQITIGIRHTLSGKPEQVFMDRWTNDFPWRFMQPSFLDQGEELKRFIAEAKPDNKWPDSTLLPKLKNSEYGVVLIDFPSRKVFSRQSYCNPGILPYVACQSTADAETRSGIVGLIKRGDIERITYFEFRTSAREQESTPADFLIKVCRKRCMWTIHLSPKVFKVDAKNDRPRKLTEANAWMKAHGWRK